MSGLRWSRVKAPELTVTLCSVIWAITIVPLIKYALVALSFGNSTGEGGPFALYTSLFPPKEVRLSFTLT